MHLLVYSIVVVVDDEDDVVERVVVEVQPTSSCVDDEHCSPCVVVDILQHLEPSCGVVVVVDSLDVHLLLG